MYSMESSEATLEATTDSVATATLGKILAPGDTERMATKTEAL